MIEEARKTLDRTSGVEPDYLAIAMAREIEHPNDRDRRELAQRDARWAKQREREAATSPAVTDWSEVDRRAKAAAREVALIVAKETAAALKQSARPRSAN